MELVVALPRMQMVDAAVVSDRIVPSEPVRKGVDRSPTRLYCCRGRYAPPGAGDHVLMYIRREKRAGASLKPVAWSDKNLVLELHA